MRCVASICLCALMVGMAYSTPAFATASPFQLQQTQAKLSAQTAAEKRIASELNSSTEKLQSLRARTTNLARDLQRSEANLTASEAKLVAIERDIALRERDLDARENEVRAAMVSMLNMQRMPIMAIFAQKESAQTTLRTAAALSMAREALLAKANAVARDVEALHSTRNNAILAQRKITEHREILTTQRSSLLRDVEERERLQTNLAKNHSVARAEVARLAQQSRSLKDLIDNIATRSKTEPVRRDIRNFGNRGSLAQPVTGTVIHRFGERKGTDDTYRGMVLRARSGAVVVAPYDGEVAFTGAFMNYGPMVLLRHKNGYISIVAGLSRTQVGLGESVSAGEPLGMMGNSPSENLYVELRENSKPIDPARWFATVTSSLARR